MSTLDRTAFRPLFPEVEDVIRRSFIFPMEHKETRIAIDLALGQTGFEKQLIQRAPLVSLGQGMLPVATAEDLILLKLIAQRPRDTDDVANIVLRNMAHLDWPYLERTGMALRQSLTQDLVPQIKKLKKGAAPE